jgi:hypothetical protein
MFLAFFPHCYIEFRDHRRPSWTHQQPDIYPHHSGTKPTFVVYFLPHVGHISFVQLFSVVYLLACFRYIILQGLAGTAGGFLQIVPLLIYYVKLFILGSTPRAVYGIKYGLRGVAWGTTFPGITLLVVISENPTITFRVSNADFLFSSPRVFHHLACHQRPGLRDLLPILPVVQISLPLAV